MSKQERKLLVERLLVKLKKAISDPFSEYRFEFAKETRLFFEKYCILHTHIKQKIVEFTTDNYHYGPTDDWSGRPGSVWEFGFKCRGREIYIKFREYKNYFTCFRIHQSKKPITYPLRHDKRGR